MRNQLLVNSGDARLAADARAQDEAAKLPEIPSDHARRLWLGPAVARASSRQPPGTRNRTWIQRHPVLVGAFVGASIGAASSIPRWNELYCATGGDEDCFFHEASGVMFGAGLGAGIGALVGVLVGR